MNDRKIREILRASVADRRRSCVQDGRHGDGRVCSRCTAPYYLEMNGRLGRRLRRAHYVDADLTPPRVARLI
jgi:hypothetical protein